MRIVHVLQLDGRQASPFLPDYWFEQYEPDWAPDGRRIVFSSQHDAPHAGDCSPDCNFDLYIADADDNWSIRLTDHPAEDTEPAWSPNGRQIAFTSYRDGVPWGTGAGYSQANSEIYVVNADGTGLTRLTNNPGWDSNPEWSPDGRRISFSSTRDGVGGLYVMNADGSGVTLLIADKYLSGSGHSWSPDGRCIAFGSARDGNAEIYVAFADGSEPVNITNHPSGDYDPDWAPFGGCGRIRTPRIEPPAAETRLFDCTIDVWHGRAGE